MNRSKQFLSLLAASVCGGAVALFLAHVLLKEKNLPAPVPAPTSASEKTKQNPELSRPLPVSGQDAGTLQAQFSETISRSMPAVVLITAQKRIGKLEAAGMHCELTGCNGGYIRLLGYTPETESSLERERQEYATAYRKWVSEHGIPPNTETIHQNISNPIRQIQL